MNIELVNTGSELMLGRVLNKHQQWLCRQLADRGYVVTRQVAVPDTGPDIEAAVREALGRAELVITTGGLGPTSDDITRDLIAQLLGKSLHENVQVLARLREFYNQRKRAMPDKAKVQALVPEGATVLPNPHGTAPGLAMAIQPNPFRADKAGSWLIMLPGPSRELRPLFIDSVVPLLARVLPSKQYLCRTLRTVGVPESLVQERIAGPLVELVAQGLDLGYCAHIGQTDVRLAAAGPEAAQLVRSAQAIVREQLSGRIFGEDDEDLETVVVRILTEQGRTLAVAESCTGGGLANRITNVPGASVVFRGGLVGYSNAAKEKFLGVREETLKQHGAVSEAVAREMAEGARRQFGTDYALSTTGIAGPGGGTADKPVGLVFIGLAGPAGTVVERQHNTFDRETFKQLTVQQALDKLRLALVRPG